MVYVEVFGGGGSVLLNKERSVREVLNDANGNLINPSCFKLNPAGPLYTVGLDGQGGAENQVGLHGEQRRVRDFHELDISSAAQNVLSGGKIDVAGPCEVLGPHILHIHPAQADVVPHLVPQVSVCCEEVQGSQQCPADSIRPHGGLLLKCVLVAFISVNHGVCFLPFFFCVQFGLNAVGLWSVRLEIWLVLHEALEELVCGFGGEEGHGKQLLSGE